MLTKTFCHIPGVGENSERKLWDAGVTSWEVALPKMGDKLPRGMRRAWCDHVEESMTHHANRNLGYFSEKLPAVQSWRLYQDFQDSCAFVDIETTGLDCYDEITTIALYDGRTIRHYINGQNLDQFPRDVKDYGLLVTYNGRSFDIPFIERHFRIRLPQAHIDLRYPLRKLGLKGGLKGCERQVGIARHGLESVDGYVAVLLWNEYRGRKNVKALETLLAYNIQDTLSLHTLVVHAHNAFVKKTPFAGSHCLPTPSLPEVPFKADRKIVERFSFRYANY